MQPSSKAASVIQDHAVVPMDAGNTSWRCPRRGEAGVCHSGCGGISTARATASLSILPESREISELAGSGSEREESGEQEQETVALKPALLPLGEPHGAGTQRSGFGMLGPPSLLPHHQGFCSP